MKKLLTLLSLSAVAAAVAFGAANNRTVKNAGASGENYIPFTIKSIDGSERDPNGNFTITSKSDEYKAEAATTEWVAGRNDTYWGGESFNALDDFYRGEKYGDWKGTISSIEWTQNTRYVMFLWGGRADGVTLNFYNGSSLIKSMNNDLSNGNPLMVNYWYIPEDIVDENTLKSGFPMHIEIVDESVGDGYGFANFGYLHYNSSKEEISQAMWDQINALKYDREENRFRAHFTMEHYSENSKFDGIRHLRARTNVNEDFENIDTFRANWFRDVVYDDGILNDMHEDTAISTFTHRTGDDNLPVNKTGKGFFKGYYEAGVGADGSQGFIPRDEARYRFVSKPFILSGTGFISIKMAGRPASLHVIRGTGRNNTDENEIEYDLLWANVKSYEGNGDSFNIAKSGMNSVTMVRHVINLRAFLGEIIQIAIVDADANGGWGATNFDELITYYPDYPTFKVDFAEQNSFFKDNDEAPATVHNFHPYYLDKYISSVASSAQDGMDYRQSAKREANTSDDSPVNEAYGFLSDYYEAVRNRNNGLTHCGKVLDLANLKTAYNNLSPEAKTIVNGSQDFDYGTDATSENWWEKTPIHRTMSESLIALGFAVPGVSSAPIISGGVSINNNSAVVVPVAIGSGALVISALVFFLFRRKRD